MRCTWERAVPWPRRRKRRCGAARSCRRDRRRGRGTGGPRRGGRPDHRYAWRCSVQRGAVLRPTRRADDAAGGGVDGRLVGGLAESGVSDVMLQRTARPTTLAVAELDGAGAATYRFYLDGTSAP